MSETRSNVAHPGLERLGHDAAQVARRYPAPGRPAPAPWQAGSLEIPDGLHKLTTGLSGYDN